MDEKARRSDRVAIGLSLEVFGNDVLGRPFRQDARTMVVTRHGARITLAQSLAPEQEVVIRCVSTGQEAAARIVARVGGDDAHPSYGVALLDGAANPWGIQFPELSPGEEVFGRVLLECIHCHSREIAHLDGAELEVLETNQSLTRHCWRCTATSVWIRSFAEPTASEHAVAQAVPPAIAEAKEKRREPRRPLKVRACIHTKDHGEHIVMTRDVSRSGLSFESQKLYGQNWNVEVALPYDPRGGNIFMPARIARVQHINENLKLYGAAYL